MSGSELAVAVAVFVVFGVTGVLIVRSAVSDWRQGRGESDRAAMHLALQQLWPALVALAVAVGVPVALAL